MPRRKGGMKLQWPETKKNHDSGSQFFPFLCLPPPHLLWNILLFCMLSRLSFKVLPSPLSCKAVITEREVITQKHRQVLNLKLPAFFGQVTA